MLKSFARIAEVSREIWHDDRRVFGKRAQVAHLSTP